MQDKNIYDYPYYVQCDKHINFNNQEINYQKKSITQFIEEIYQRFKYIYSLEYTNIDVEITYKVTAYKTITYYAIIKM